MRNFRFGFFLILAFLVIAGPVLVYGEEPKRIVPCDGPDCRACDFIQLGQNIINWFIKISASVIALTFAWGGMKMVMSGGDTGAVSSARSIMTNSVIGLVILLGSWLIVNTILNLLVKDEYKGKWYEIQCTVLPPSPTAPATPPVIGTPTAGVIAPGTLSHSAALSELGKAGVKVTSTSGASGVKETCPTTAGCTTLTGIRQDTLQQAINIKESCTACNVEITGAVEPHSGGTTGQSHGAGYKIDINDNQAVDNFLKTKLTADGQRTGDHGGPRYRDSCGNEYVLESTHWDITVSKGSCKI
ncbi:MAG: pilin [Candidatus Kaiserbacteria bacterium]|nr:pilin [Candidatus Kaiserbacteria bacterium]